MKNTQKIEKGKESNQFKLGIPFGRMFLMIAGLIAIVTIVMKLSGCSSLSLSLKILGSEVDLKKGECSLTITPE